VFKSKTSVKADGDNLLLNLRKPSASSHRRSGHHELILRAGDCVVRDHPWEGRRLQEATAFHRIALAQFPDMRHCGRLISRMS
jgi:hypothetical protein